MRCMLVLALAALAPLAVGCAKRPPAKDTTEVTSARSAKRSVAVTDDIMKACKIHLATAFGGSRRHEDSEVTLESVERAPKFDFDDADLLPEDRDVLEQIAKCVTNGPLKGRALSLVGRCDPRGEVEYNMVLGDYRAESVHNYLARLGVDPGAMAKTTRGDLDAEGKDEDGWQRDRRVDIALQASPAVATR